MDNHLFIIFRNDDICALSDAKKERRILEIFEKYRIPQVISVIPNMTEDPHNSQINQYHRLDENPEIVALLKEYHAKGLVEIAQHGYTHQTNQFHPSKKEEITEKDYYQGIDRRWLSFSPANPLWYSEFNGLSYEEKRKKITSGQRLLEEALETRVRTFAFPWDSLDQQCLKVLDDCGFKTVLCADNAFKSGNLNLITGCYNDIFSFPGLVKEMETLKQPVFTHVEYHSWMLSDEEILRVDNILDGISSNRNIKIIMPSQMQEFIPGFKKIQDLRYYLNVLTSRTNVFLGKEIKILRYFVLNKLYYAWNILKTWILNVLVGVIGYKKALGITCLTLTIFVYSKLTGDYRNQYNMFDVVILILLITLVLFALFLNLKGIFYAQRTRR